jgi:hypothetical protein
MTGRQNTFNTTTARTKQPIRFFRAVSETDYKQEERRQVAHTGEDSREAVDMREEDKSCMPRA